MPRLDLIYDETGRRIVETPLQCSPAQMRLALHRAGLLATVQAIAASDLEASIVWEYATVILRNSPFISAFQGAAGLTDSDIDALFNAAMAV